MIFFFKTANKKWHHAQRRMGNGTFFLCALVPVKTRKIGTAPQGSQVCLSSNPYQDRAFSTISRLQVRKYNDLGGIEWA